MKDSYSLLIILLLLCVSAHGEGLALSVHGSVEGYGLELTSRYSDSVNVRLGYHEYGFKGADAVGLIHTVNKLTTGDISPYASSYDHNIKQSIVSGIADWYMGNTQVRLSTGLLYNKSEDNITGKSSLSGGYTLNGTYYTGGQVGSLTGTSTYKGFAPYFGVGWGNPVAKNSQWKFLFDMGVMYQGKPKVALSATGTAAGLQADVAAEQERLRNDSFAWAPLMALGLSYQW